MIMQIFLAPCTLRHTLPASGSGRSSFLKNNVVQKHFMLIPIPNLNVPCPKTSQVFKTCEVSREAWANGTCIQRIDIT